MPLGADTSSQVDLTLPLNSTSFGSSYVRPLALKMPAHVSSVSASTVARNCFIGSSPGLELALINGGTPGKTRLDELVATKSSSRPDAWRSTSGAVSLNSSGHALAAIPTQTAGERHQVTHRIAEAPPDKLPTYCWRSTLCKSPDSVRSNRRTPQRQAGLARCSPCVRPGEPPKVHARLCLVVTNRGKTCNRRREGAAGAGSARCKRGARKHRSASEADAC